MSSKKVLALEKSTGFSVSANLRGRSRPKITSAVRGRYSPGPKALEKPVIAAESVTSTEMPISIVIADMNGLACKLLESELSKYRRQFTIVGLATTCKQLLILMQETDPAIVLIGLDLEDGPASGLNAIQQLRQHHVSSRSILLVDRFDRDVVTAAFRSGSRGIFLRSESDLRMLRKCIQYVHLGHKWANPEVFDYILDTFMGAAPPQIINVNGSAILSAREEMVVQLVAGGLSNRDIARELKLSEHTIKNYLFHIFDKVGVSNRVELVLFASAHMRSPERSDGYTN